MKGRNVGGMRFNRQQRRQSGLKDGPMTTEGRWKREVADSLAGYGVETVIMATDATSNGMPDRCHISQFGPVFVEYKMPNGIIRENQRLKMRLINSKTLHGSGRLYCFTQVYPNIFGIAIGSGVIALAEADPVAEPVHWINTVLNWVDPIRRGCTTEHVKNLIEDLELLQLPWQKFKVTQGIPLREITAADETLTPFTPEVVTTYEIATMPGLAIKMATGVSKAEYFSIYHNQVDAVAVD